MKGYNIKLIFLWLFKADTNGCCVVKLHFVKKRLFDMNRIEAFVNVTIHRTRVNSSDRQFLFSCQTCAVCTCILSCSSFSAVGRDQQKRDTNPNSALQIILQLKSLVKTE